MDQINHALLDDLFDFLEKNHPKTLSRTGKTSISSYTNDLFEFIEVSFSANVIYQIGIFGLGPVKLLKIYSIRSPMNWQKTEMSFDIRDPNFSLRTLVFESLEKLDMGLFSHNY